MVEGVAGHDAQTVNLAPSQGGWVEFTLDQEGSYPFVTHAFGDMVKGAVGVLATENAPSAIDEALSSRMRTTSGALPSPLALSATIRSPRRLRSSPDATTTWVSAGFQRFGE